MSAKLIIPYHITPTFIEQHEEISWLFSASLDGKSFSGQCSIGNLYPNRCFPIYTKRDWCESSSDCWWHDNQFASVTRIIDECFQRIPKDASIIIPFPKIGRGCAELQIRAPAILEYVKSKIERVMFKDYQIQTTDGRLLCPQV